MILVHEHNYQLSEEVMVYVVLLAELVYHLEQLFICFYLFTVYASSLLPPLLPFSCPASFPGRASA